ncbi:hypothetical protein [Candidatus Palauibacter soopunensis]|uniref:hypothetical protein n=1 Tax=Candidatus Palauibacter soopunensis TaxID=3056739 RepID=UPI00239333F0|nr:hypothetical protein [Candidatus Palauibacter soopunensis]MDE2878448.1 hypothetical protein [Candidatus Palauibacter soopunensis]
MPASRVQHGVGWLLHRNVGQPALGGAARNASPGIARNSLDRAVSGKLPGLVVASLADGEDDGGALCEARLRPDPYPSET